MFCALLVQVIIPCSPRRLLSEWRSNAFHANGAPPCFPRFGGGCPKRLQPGTSGFAPFPAFLSGWAALGARGLGFRALGLGFRI